MKCLDPDDAELHDSLLQSLSLVQQLVEVDQEIEQAKAAQDSIGGRLRLAYDWEISRLYQAVSHAPDEGLLIQLMIMREERQKLGDSAIDPERMRYPVDMSNSAGDGPDEILQKVELLEDRASLLRQKNGNWRSI